MYPWFLNVKLLPSIKIRLMAMFGMQTLILQLTVSLYFAYAFNKITGYNRYIGAAFCGAYPLLIGIVKTLESKLTEPFEVQEIYEFAALSLAAMPYRFVFLGVDRIETAMIIILIKFMYKSSLDYIIFTR